MKQHIGYPTSPTLHPLSRRALLRSTVAAGALVAGTAALGGPLLAEAATTPTRQPGAGGSKLAPRDAFDGLLAALRRYPLVAMTERHMLQEWHDLITALLTHPALPGAIDD